MVAIAVKPILASGRLKDLWKAERSFPLAVGTHKEAPGSETFLALLDVMGFRELTHKKRPHELLDLLRELRDALEMSVKSKIGKEGSEAEIRVVIYSDSILMYSIRGSPNSFIRLVGAVGNAITVGLKRGLLLRGAITKGSLGVLNNGTSLSPGLILAGQGLTRAYDFEQAQEWCGAVIDVEQVCKTEVDQAALDYCLVEGLVRPYEVPWKGVPGSLAVLAVNWPAVSAMPRAQVIAAFRRLLGTPRPVELAKHQATLAFFDSIGAYSELDIHRQRARARMAISFGEEFVQDVALDGSSGEQTKDQF